MAERRVVVTEAASGIGAAAWRAPAAARRREGAARAPLEPDAPERPAAETMGGLDVPASDAGFARSHDAIAFLRRAAPHLRTGREPRSVVVSSFVSSAFRADVPVLPAYAAAEEAPARAGAGAGAGGHRLPRPAGRGPRGGTGAARGGRIAA